MRHQHEKTKKEGTDGYQQRGMNLRVMRIVFHKESQQRVTSDLFHITSEYSHCPVPVTIRRAIHVIARRPSCARPFPTPVSRITRMMMGAHDKLSQAMALIAQSTASQTTPKTTCARHPIVRPHQS